MAKTKLGQYGNTFTRADHVSATVKIVSPPQFNGDIGEVIATRADRYLQVQVPSELANRVYILSLRDDQYSDYTPVVSKPMKWYNKVMNDITALDIPTEYAYDTWEEICEDLSAVEESEFIAMMYKHHNDMVGGSHEVDKLYNMVDNGIVFAKMVSNICKEEV